MARNRALRIRAIQESLRQATQLVSEQDPSVEELRAAAIQATQAATALHQLVGVAETERDLNS